MRRTLSGFAAVLLTAAALTVQQSPATAAEIPLTGYVNPFVGTDDSNSPNPVGGGAGGSTFPGATVPFGMVQFSPGHAHRIAVGLPRPGPHDRVVQPDPLQRRGLPQQRGPADPADHRGDRLLARLRLDQLRVGVHQVQRDRRARLLQEPARQVRHGRRAQRDQTHRRAAADLPGDQPGPGADQRQPLGHRRPGRQRHHHRQPGLGRAHRRRVLRRARRSRCTTRSCSTARPPASAPSRAARSAPGRPPPAAPRPAPTSPSTPPSNAVVNATVGISFVSVANAQNNATAEAGGLRDGTVQRGRRLEHRAEPRAGDRRRDHGPAEVLHGAVPRAAEPEPGQRHQRRVPRLRQRRAHREPPDLPELLGLGHLPLLGVAGRADRAGRDDRHREVDGPGRTAGRPAAEVVAPERRGLRDAGRSRPDRGGQRVRLRRPRLRHGGRAGADEEGRHRRKHPGGRAARQPRGLQLQPVHPGQPVGDPGVRGLRLRHRPVRQGRSATPPAPTTRPSARSTGAASSTASRATSTPATATAASAGRSTRRPRARTWRATPPSTPGWCRTTSAR